MRNPTRTHVAAATGGARPGALALAAFALFLLATLAFAQQKRLHPCQFSPDVRDYRYCDFTQAELKGLDFEGADLRGAKLDWARLDGANLQEANLAAPDSGDGPAPVLYRTYFKSGLLVGANFHQAQLPYAHFDIADLSEADFEGANLEGVTLIAAFAVETNFRNANLRGARMMETDFSDADLRGADLRLADLEFANLEGAKLDGAKFAGTLNPEGHRCRGDEPSIFDCVLERGNYDRYRALD